MLTRSFLSLALTLAIPLASAASSYQEKSTKECDPQSLGRARGALKADNLRQARAILNELRDCEGQLGRDARAILQDIQRKETITDLWSHYLIDLHNHEIEAACLKLSRIEELDPGYPGLQRARDAAGGCDEELRQLRVDLGEAEALYNDGKLRQAFVVTERIVKARPDFEDARRLLETIKEAQAEALRRTLESNYAKAEKLIRDNDWERARNILTAIAKQDRGYMDVQGLLRRCEDALRDANGETVQSQNSPASTSQPARSDAYDSLRQSAELLLDQGRYEEALRTERQAAAAAPREADTNDLGARIRSAEAAEKADLEAILEAFFGGRYTTAAARSHSFLQRPRQSRTRAFALFFEASSQLSVRALEGNLSDDDVRSARVKIENAKRINESVTYWWKYVSPRLRSLVDSAASGTGVTPDQTGQ